MKPYLFRPFGKEKKEVFLFLEERNDDTRHDRTGALHPLGMIRFQALSDKSNHNLL
jgi:hypothetical protein